MKKNILCLLIVTILLITGINRVSASSYNGKLYEVWHPDSGFTVFAEEKNRNMDYNSWMIKSTIDDKIYYCIDPATPLEGSYQGSHNIYTNKDEIISKTDFTEEKYKKVQLLSYYGYGYKDNKIDHTDKKWYGITQVLIWRVMRPDLTWTFKENRNAVPNESLFLEETKELNKLVDDYYKYPSFVGKTIKTKAGERITINDDNNVIEKYHIRSKSDFLNIDIKNNSINVYSEYSSLYLINFEITSKTNEQFGALVSSDFQDIIRMGAPAYQSFSLMIEVDGGFVNIQKTDSDTKINKSQGDATLKDAEYGIYDLNNNLITTVKTDENGLAKTGLPYGQYLLKELKAPNGYKINSETKRFTSSGRDNYIAINVEDEIIKGTIRIIKTKGGSGESFVKEDNAVFEVLNSKKEVVGNLTTDENGESFITLPYGSYILKQVKGEEGYQLSKDIKIDIQEEKNYEINIKNKKKSTLEFSKTDYSLDLPVPNTLIEIYKDDNTLIYSGRTDENGKIIIYNLDIGKYYILEKDAPKYYRLNKEKMPFEIKEDGEIVRADMKNYRKEGSLKIIKRDKQTKELLQGVSFDVVFMETNKVMFKGITDINGEINIKTLIAGKYCVIETNTKEGYKLLNKKECFEIDEDNEQIELVLKNEKNTINVPKTLSIDFIKIIASLLIIIGLGYYVYEKNN